MNPPGIPAMPAHVRCCEDQRSDNEEMVCKVCPLGLTSDAGAVHEDGCRCKHGANAEGGCKLPEPAKKSCGSGEFREGSLENCAELKKVGFVDTSRKNHKGEAVCSAARVNGKCS